MKPAAFVSIDLDNQWAYLRSHGKAGWEAHPSFLDLAVPRMLEFLSSHGVKAVFFVVGRDLENEADRDYIRSIHEAGHELGNHSMNHIAWLADLPEEEIQDEIALAEERIEALAGACPLGFRAPGYSISPRILEILAARGHLYDASLFPNSLAPMARRLFNRQGEGSMGSPSYGSASLGLPANRISTFHTTHGDLIEYPISVLPGLHLPLHASYLFALGGISMRLARCYIQTALQLIRASGQALSFLLHPTDFLDGAEIPQLAFLPGMSISSKRKLELLHLIFTRMCDGFEFKQYGEEASARRRKDAGG